jgi:hypothetical protein
MSIVITQEPQFLTPSDNPIIYGFGTDIYQPSPNSGSLKYKLSFVVKVFMQVFGEIGLFEVYPEFNDINNTYSFGKIDISNIVRSYLKLPNIVPKQYDSNVIFDSGVNARQANILVYEKYATTIEGETALYTSIVSSITTVFKGCLSDKEFLDFDPNDYNVGNFNKKFLTDKPKIDFIPPLNVFLYVYDFVKDDSIHFSYFDIDVLNQINYDKILRISYFDGTNNVNFEIQYPAGNQGVYNSIYINIKSLVDLGVFTQTIADGLDWLSIGVVNPATEILITPLVYLKIKKPCFYPGKSLKFLNKFGAYDYFLFEHNERKSASIKSHEYESKNGEWSIFTFNFSIDKLRDGRKSYLKQTNEKLQLVSGYLDQAEQNWLTQLYESPLIFLNYNNGDVQSVVITNTSYTIKQDQYDELYNEIVDIEFTTKNSIEL